MSSHIIAHTSLLPAAIAVERSDNQKLGKGKVSATMASQSSCPPTCPFLEAGCYAANGYCGITTARLNDSPVTDPVAIANEEAAAIATLSGKRPLRLHVVGDSTTDETARILATAVRKFKQHGKRKYGVEPAAWTYSHGWRNIKRKSFGSISVLASVESTADVAMARNRGYNVALVVDRF